MLLDCDPGHDDAIAIMLAVADPTIDLIAVTTVAGNVTLEHTTRNALRASGPKRARMSIFSMWWQAISARPDNTNA